MTHLHIVCPVCPVTIRVPVAAALPPYRHPLVCPQIRSSQYHAYTAWSAVLVTPFPIQPPSHPGARRHHCWCRIRRLLYRLCSPKQARGRRTQGRCVVPPLSTIGALHTKSIAFICFKDPNVAKTQWSIARVAVLYVVCGQYDTGSDTQSTISECSSCRPCCWSTRSLTYSTQNIRSA